MQLVQLTDASKDVAQLLKLNSQRMMRAAPKGFDPQRLLSVAANAILYNTDLLECTRESLIGGCFEALKLGLTLGGPMQEAWLIPFRNSRSGKKEATFIIGYPGYRNLIDRARSTLDLHPRAVHNGNIPALNRTFAPGIPDEFDYWFGDEPRIIHRPKNPMPEFKEQLQAVYVVARLRGGGKQMEVLEVEEIERHRNRSRAKDNGPWNPAGPDYVPMALKTGIRKIAKYLPKASIELARAMALDNAADSGDSQDFDIEGMVIPPAELRQAENASPPKALEAMKERMRVEQPAEKIPVPAGPSLTDEDIDFGGRR